MAQDFTNTVSSVGTASRDFATVALWNASVPADPRTGGGTNTVGEMFADSVFTDVNIDLGPVTSTNMTQACNVILRNAPGEKPVWKPTGASVFSYLAIRRGIVVSGIIFDGDDRDVSGGGMVILSDQGPTANSATIIGSTFKNSSSNGLRLATSNGGQGNVVYCLAFDNAGGGIQSTAADGNSAGRIAYCGSAFNGGAGYGANVSTSRITIVGSWARGNTGAAVGTVVFNLAPASSHNVIDDGSFTTIGLTLGGSGAVNVLENATQANFAFANEATRDFTPGAGSVLLGEGAEQGSNNAVLEPFDVNGNRLFLSGGTQLDVGPIQSSVISSTATATSSVSACITAIRDLFTTSTSFLNWIQSINVAETTAGHVFLGYDPRTVAKSEETDGPNVFIYLATTQSSNELSAKTYRDICQVVADIVWFQDDLASNTFITEIDFIFGIVAEAKAKGIELSSTFGGEIFDMTTVDTIAENPNDRIERHTEIRFFIRMGKDV